MKALFKTAIATACLAGVLVVTGATGAEARVKGPRMDSLSYACGALQDEADKLVKEYGNATYARQKAILARLGDIGEMWREHCQGTFGTIHPLSFPARLFAPRDALDPGSVGPVNHTDPAPRWDPKVLTPDQSAKVLEAAEETEDAPATDDTSKVDTSTTTSTTAPLAERARPKARTVLSHSS